ncbi:PIN domain-containing protein [Flexivirga sp. B27]
MAKAMSTDPPPSYLDALIAELDAIERDMIALLKQSEIRYVNPNANGSGIYFVGAADFGWGASDPGLEAERMALLRTVREWVPRFELLFPHPTPEVEERHHEATRLLERWLVRSGGSDHSIPRTTHEAIQVVRAHVTALRGSQALLPDDEYPSRLVVDTNTILDNPDLSAHVTTVGDRYMAHLLPVVLRELDDLKRSGRNPEIREAARRADRRLKGLRTNGDVSVGVKVAGRVWARFDHIEPRDDGRLPSWLDLAVPDDRLVASALLLQSDHPGARLTVATGDLNLQTKLAAVGLPFVELPT